jgi:hypothetical protein
MNIFKTQQQKGVFTYDFLISFAKKLAKLGVKLDELPINARYYELIEYLQRQGYKIK